MAAWLAGWTPLWGVYLLAWLSPFFVSQVLQMVCNDGCKGQCHMKQDCNRLLWSCCTPGM